MMAPESLNKNGRAEGPPQTPGFQSLTDLKAEAAASALSPAPRVFVTHPPSPSALLPFASSLFLHSATLQRASLVSLAQRPRDREAGRCRVSGRQRGVL